MKLVVVALCLLTASASIAEDIKTHVTTLASEAMGGRLTGSDGARMAADYIIKELERLGASPLPGRSSFQLPFEFTAGVRDTGSSLSLDLSSGEWSRSQRRASRALVLGDWRG